MGISADQLLAVVAVINAVGSVIALIIHAIRVPYRESAATEQIQAADSINRVRLTNAQLSAAARSPGGEAAAATIPAPHPG
jgi:hypothetical protein